MQKAAINSLWPPEKLENRDLAGALSRVTYWVAVWAMTVAPIALVTALRETSMLFAVMTGVFWMKERAEWGKLLAAVTIVSGIVLIRI